MATFKARMREFAERMTGLRMFRVLPRGIDIFHDLRTRLPRVAPGVVFDVGANVGQSTLEFLHAFPRARIYAFEPVRSVFNTLRAGTAAHPNVECVNLAFSSRGGQARIALSPMGSALNEIVTGPSAGVTESVELSTLDSFCAARRLATIGYLKIDTEGHDFEVLRGADGLLGRQAADVVQIEVGLNPSNRKFVPFETIKQHLESYDYRLFGIYEQVEEHYTGEAHLRRANVVFVSAKVRDENRVAPTDAEGNIRPDAAEVPAKPRDVAGPDRQKL